MDRIEWENREMALTGLNRFLETDIANAMVPLVAEGYDSFFGSTVLVYPAR